MTMVCKRLNQGSHEPRGTGFSLSKGNGKAWKGPCATTGKTNVLRKGPFKTVSGKKIKNNGGHSEGHHEGGKKETKPKEET